MRRVLTLTAVTAVAAITAVTITLAGGDGNQGFFPVGPGGDGPLAAGALVPYDSCEALATDMAERSSLARGVGVGTDAFMDDMAMDGEMMAESSVAGGAVADTAAVPAPVRGGTSTTNTAVAGIDEPDLVETDGRRLFSVVDGQGLLVADVTAATPTVLARVPLDDLGWSQLLLVGDRLLVVGQVLDDRFGPSEGGAAASSSLPMSGTTRLALFDVSQDVPTRIATTDVEGQLVTARGVGGTVHLVSQTFPNPIPVEAFDAAMRTGDPEAAIAAQLAQIPGEDFLPRVASASGTTRMACDAVSFVPGTRDAAVLSIHTFDAGRDDLAPTGSSAIVSDGQHVHATADRLAVATTVWPDQNSGGPQPLVDPPAPGVEADPAATTAVGPTTLVHLFQIDAGGAAHLASGQVEGFLLNQFAMSWHDGHLRVASTIEDWTTGASVSQLAVLRPDGGDLVPVGVVGDLGPTETIRSVRYLGDTAYVVTFRQTDPFYVIDLRDPTNPLAVGELKITGFSAYLHPLDEGYVLGIGQEATQEGFTTGLQVQVFDVRNPAAPVRTDQIVLAEANSQAEFDHLAVTVHEGRLYLPYTRHGVVDELVVEELPAPPAPAVPAPGEEQTEFVVQNGELVPVDPREAAPVEPEPFRDDIPFPQDVEQGVIVVEVGRQTLTEVARLTMDTGNGDPFGGEVQRVVVVDGNPVLVGRQQIDIYTPTLRRLATLR